MGLLGIGGNLDKLEDDQVEDVVGGYTHYAGGSFGGNSRFEVIHDKAGEVLASFDGPDSFAQASANAQELGMTTNRITDNQLDAMRERYKKGK